jgi:integrase
VDFSAGIVRLEPGTTKNDEGRVFPFAALPELVRLLRAHWEQTISLELATGQTIPTVFHWNDHGTFKPIHPEVLYRRWKEACKRAGVPRSVAMKLTGTKPRRCIGAMRLSVRPI